MQFLQRLRMFRVLVTIRLQNGIPRFRHHVQVLHARRHVACSAQVGEADEAAFGTTVIVWPVIPRIRTERTCSHKMHVFVLFRARFTHVRRKRSYPEYAEPRLYCAGVGSWWSTTSPTRRADRRRLNERLVIYTWVRGVDSRPEGRTDTAKSAENRSNFLAKFFTVRACPTNCRIVIPDLTLPCLVLKT